MATNIGTVGSARNTKTPKVDPGDALARHNGADIEKEPMLNQLTTAVKKQGVNK